MKVLLIFSFMIFLMSSAYGSAEGDFLKTHVLALIELDSSVRAFQKELHNAQDLEIIKSKSSQYSSLIQKKIESYSKYVNSDYGLITEIAADITEMLSLILEENTQLLGKLQTGMNDAQLREEYTIMLNKKHIFLNDIMGISFGIGLIMMPAKQRSNSTKNVKLTRAELDKIYKLLKKTLGDELLQRTKESSENIYEYGYLAAYSFIELALNFKK